MEQRYNSLEISSANGRRMSGYAATYNTLSSPDALPFRERIAPGAFRSVLRNSDAVMLLNHDASAIIGRQSAGTLRLSEDSRGLHYECDLPESPLGENVRAACARGDLRECSFGFVVDNDGDEWSDETDPVTGERYTMRTIRNFRSLSDVSLVTFPAYPGTSAGVRSFFPGGIPAELRTRFPEMAKKSPREISDKRYAKNFENYVLNRVNEDRFREVAEDRWVSPETEKRFGGVERRAGTDGEYWGRPTSQTYVGGDLQGGTTSGVAGGYTVPMEFATASLNGMAQYTDLLHPDVVHLDVSKDGSLRGKTFPGWDISQYAALRVGDSVQVNPNGSAQVLPTAFAKFTSSYIYRASVAVAIELEQDSEVDGGIVPSIGKIGGIALARAIGTDLIRGTGSGQPQGLLNGAKNVQLNNTLSFDWLTDLYYSVDRFYRASKKCAWVMTDSTMRSIRRMASNTGMPLLSIKDDEEQLFGKRVIISPDIPDDQNSSPAQAASIIFGDLEHFVVRISQTTVQRSLQSGLPNGVGDISRGEILLNCRCRADAVVHDPTNGVVPPLVYSTFTGVQYAPGLALDKSF